MIVAELHTGAVSGERLEGLKAEAKEFFDQFDREYEATDFGRDITAATGRPRPETSIPDSMRRRTLNADTSITGASNATALHSSKFARLAPDKAGSVRCGWDGGISALSGKRRRGTAATEAV